MQLGALFNRLEDEGDAALALEALGDMVLFTEVRECGERHEETPGAYVAGAARRFASLGGDEDWLALMNAVERDPEPGKAAIRQILRWSLKRDEAQAASPPAAGGCGCGGGGGCHDHA